MITKSQLKKLREDTPGLESGLFFNSAGASLRPRLVTEAVKNFLDEEDRIGVHLAARNATQKIESIYASAAKLINAESAEIALMESNTRAWHSIIYALDFHEGDEVVFSAAEYASGYMAFEQLRRRRNIAMHVVGYSDDGTLDLSTLESVLTRRTKLVALTHVSTSNGTIHPVAEAGRIIRNRCDAFYLLDACQSIGQMQVDVKETGCDALTFTGRKHLRAPRGTGILYVRRNHISPLLPLLPDSHTNQFGADLSVTSGTEARRFEVFEVGVASFIGLGVAIDYALEIGLHNIESRIRLLADDLRQMLSSQANVCVHETGTKNSGIVTFSVTGLATEKLVEKLTGRGITVKFVDFNTAARDLETRGLKSVVRASVHYFNSEAEIALLSQAVAEISQ